jgi:ankyrin repeat protein
MLVDASKCSFLFALTNSNWRAMETLMSNSIDAFFAACRAGDIGALRDLLATHPELTRERDAAGNTGLHLAVAHVDCVRLLLEHGADPNARESGDNATPLHFAAANGHLDSLRALLDAGGDVQGSGDLHHGGVIGWAIGDGRNVHADVVSLLIEHGARLSVFSAIAMNDLDAARAIVERDPAALSSRRSRFEQGQTPLHFALASPDGNSPKVSQYDMADLLISLGADVDAKDDKGRTAIEIAILHGDLEAVRRLKAAGATEPSVSANLDPSSLRDSMHKQITPMLCVSDVDATVAWYTSLGFEIRERYPESGGIGWAALSFGHAALMVQSVVARKGNQVALWFHTNAVEELYEVLKNRQIEAVRAGRTAIEFLENLYEPFYGGRQFSVRDASGIELVFYSE